MSVSRTRDCQWCGRRIQFRQMPHGRFVAWDLSDDQPHLYPSKAATGPTGPTSGNVVRPTPIEPGPPAAITQPAARPPVPSRASASGRDSYRNRRDAALADLAIRRFTGPEWSARLRARRAEQSAPNRPLEPIPAPATPGLLPWRVPLHRTPSQTPHRRTPLATGRNAGPADGIRVERSGRCGGRFVVRRPRRVAGPTTNPGTGRRPRCGGRSSRARGARGPVAPGRGR